MKITPTVSGRLGVGTSAGGDLGGGLPSPTVVGIRGVPVCVMVPTTGDALIFDGTEWCPAPPGGGGSGPFVNVITDYGAVGDDTTDDTAAIQAAVDAWKEAGATIWFPPDHIYKITATIDIDPIAPVGFLKFLGAGTGTTGAEPISGLIRMATANTTAFACSNVQDVTFEAMFIKGPGGGSSGYGITSAADIHTISTRIQGFYTGLHQGNQSYFSKHYRSMFYGNVHSGVTLDSAGNNAEFFACRFQTTAYGIDIGGCQSVDIVGGSVESCSAAGIRANGGNNMAGLYIAGTYFEQADGVTDILLGDSTITYGTTIVGCTHVKSSYSGTGWAIHAVRAPGLSINGGNIDSSDAIWVETYPANITLPNLRNAGTITVVVGSIILDPAITTAASAVGTASHGSSPYLAPIDHGHALGGTVAGDLSGTLPNPTVAKINGIAVTGTPAVGYVPTATSTTAATWQAPAASGGGELLISDTPSTPLIFADLIQNEAQTDLVYAG